MRHSSSTKIQSVISGRSTLFFSSILVCGYLLICLFTFLLLQGDMNDWIAFMHGEARARVFAALGFLTKSSLGYFFIFTGLAGFLWRFYYMKRALGFFSFGVSLDLA